MQPSGHVRGNDINLGTKRLFGEVENMYKTHLNCSVIQ